MPKRSEKSIIAAGLVVLACALLNVLLFARTRVMVIPALWPYLTVTVAILALVWGRYRLRRLSDEEARDEAAAQNAPASTSLFAQDESELDPFSYRKALAQLERWVAPVFAPTLALLVLGWAHRLFWNVPDAWGTSQRLFASTFLIGQGFVLFLFGRYFLGLSRSPGHRLLRGPGTMLVLACFASMLAGAAAIIADTSYPAAEGVVRRALALFLGLIALEWLLNTVAWLYRPKRKNDPVLTYESRLCGLLTDPASWTSSIARAVDYQFGFQVSETGFYRFLQRSLLPFILLQIFLLYILSTIVVLGPEELGLRERLGKPLPDAQVGPGLHVKWPWPFERIVRHPARRILTTHIGFTAHEDDERPRVMLWTVPHYREEDQFIVASREAEQSGDQTDAAVAVNLISVNVPVEYRITNLYQHIYGHAEPELVLRQIAYRALTRELASRDLIALLGPERNETRAALHNHIQQEALALDLGISIVFTGLQGVHPPIPVADAFESVIASLEQKETSILTARAYRNRIRPMAEAEAAERQWIAQGERARRGETALADADLYRTRLSLHQNFPGVYAERLYLSALRAALRDPHTFIVDNRADHETLIFNLEEKVTPDLFDFGSGTGEDLFL